MTDECVFCQIIADQETSYPVYETRSTRTFLDVFPGAPGHCLIVTKDHYRDIFEAPPEDIALIGHVSTLIAHTLKQELDCDAVAIFQLNGAAAGQTVFHYHMHVVPRNHGQELQLHSRESADPAELQAMADRLRARAEMMLVEE